MTDERTAILERLDGHCATRKAALDIQSVKGRAMTTLDELGEITEELRLATLSVRAHGVAETIYAQRGESFKAKVSNVAGELDRYRINRLLDALEEISDDFKALAAEAKAVERGAA